MQRLASQNSFSWWLWQIKQILSLQNATVGTLITTINATDRDEDVNAQVKFTIISGNDDERFTLNETNGELRTAKSLDYDQEPKFYKVRMYYNLCSTKFC